MFSKDITGDFGEDADSITASIFCSASSYVFPNTYPYRVFPSIFPLTAAETECIIESSRIKSGFGKNIELMFDLLPGYVFAYASQPVKEMSQLKVDGVIRLLGSPEKQLLPY